LQLALPSKSTIPSTTRPTPTPTNTIPHCTLHSYEEDYEESGYEAASKLADLKRAARTAALARQQQHDDSIKALKPERSTQSTNALRLASAIQGRLTTLARTSARSALPTNAPASVHARLWQIWGAAAAAKPASSAVSSSSPVSAAAAAGTTEQLAAAIAPLLACMPSSDATTLQSDIAASLDVKLSDGLPALVVAPRVATIISAADGPGSNGAASKKLRAVMASVLEDLFLHEVIAIDVKSGSGVVHELVKGSADKADGSSSSSSSSSTMTKLKAVVGGSRHKGLSLPAADKESQQGKFGGRGRHSIAELRKK